MHEKKLDLVQVFDLLNNLDIVKNHGVKTFSGKTEKYRLSATVSVHELGNVTLESEYRSDDRKLIPFVILSPEQKKILNNSHVHFRFSKVKELPSGDKRVICFPLTREIITRFNYM